jgi:hypothetical protein
VRPSFKKAASVLAVSAGIKSLLIIIIGYYHYFNRITHRRILEEVNSKKEN